MKTMRTDWRNPERWTRVQRRGGPDRASVSMAWDRNPFGLGGTEVLVAVQPGVFCMDGVAVMQASGFNGDVGKLAGGGLFRDPGICLWSSGRQSVWALDFTNREVARDWAGLIAEHFQWAGGVHFDYFTDLGWLAPNRDWAYWDAWNVGWRVACRALRDLRPDWTLLGQQFHLTPITDQVDGLFLEESPGHFGLSFEEIRQSAEHHGHASDWVIELRNPETFPAEYVMECSKFVEDMGCFGSFGRDAESWA